MIYYINGGGVMIYEKIKLLREGSKMTQAELARQLGVTRSGVNAWEMGITMPSTQYIIKLAEIFNISTDYLLDVKKTSTVSIEGLSDREIASVVEIINCYKLNKK